MTILTCCISGLPIAVQHLRLKIPATIGYYHPIFAVPRSTLLDLYTSHIKGELTDTDSYLLFLALLHSSNHIDWQAPASLIPTNHLTNILIENNIAQLVSVLERTDTITAHDFAQPTYVVRSDSTLLQSIPNWIKAWDENINTFLHFRNDMIAYEKIAEVANKLSVAILSAEPLANYTNLVAEWAAKAGNFPHEKDIEYKRVIRSCFNSTSMFNTPLVLIKEIRNYCEENIEAGSIHFHALMKVLNAGVKNHIDYLGATYSISDYVILADSDSSSQNTPEQLAANATRQATISAQLADIRAGASKELPVASNYSSNLEFLKAKLAYRLAKSGV